MGILSGIGSTLLGAVGGFFSGGPAGALAGGVAGAVSGFSKGKSKSTFSAQPPSTAMVPVPDPGGFQFTAQGAGKSSFTKDRKFAPGTVLGGGATPLQIITTFSGERPSTARVRELARVCGIPETAARFNVPESVICDIIVSRRRRSRGISSADLRRTRSTIRKINTMSRNLAQLCRPAARRR